MNDTKTNQQLFFEQAEKEAAAKPILQLLHRYFINRQDKIFVMKAEMQSDEIIRDFISNAFGIYGGGSMENGWYEYAGGTNPRLELQDKQFNLIDRIEGQKLVSAFRSLYHIPKDGQLCLF